MYREKEERKEKKARMARGRERIEMKGKYKTYQLDAGGE